MSTSRRGASCVEFAFVAPYLFFLVFGAIEVSRIVMIKQALTNAAREGTRKAVLVNTNDDNTVDSIVRDRLKGTIAGYLDSAIVRITVSPSNLAGLAPGTEISTTVEVDCQDITWLPANFFDNMTITTTVTMKRE